ncbi:MAG: HAMP domain-containing protein [Candidatus Eisenbacteria bacterium]|nr:HAMP domain-containing protein [Candidatus Eisenbacteria bacterium]
MIFPLRTRLAASIVIVVLAMGVVSTIVGTRLFADSLVRQVQQGVEQDLNTAYLVYESRLREVETSILLAANDAEVVRPITVDRPGTLASVLSRIRERRGLDFLTVTDAEGIVIARVTGGAGVGDDRGGEPLVGRVLETDEPVRGTVLMEAERLALERAGLADSARIGVLETPRARPTERSEISEGMVLASGAPVRVGGRTVGMVYGGVLLNRREEIVDNVKQTAYGGETWKGKEIGTATIFRDDTRIATNVLDAGGDRAIGTRVSEEVYEKVVGEGERWIARAFVVDDWYITAYGPIRDLGGRVVGMLYVGVLADKFDAIRAQTVWTFAGVSVAGMVLALVIASILSTGILRPIRHLLQASREIAKGNFKTRVDIDPNAANELVELGESFNFMAQSIAERDERLQENARKMTESKKLATLGQLAAGIAHEINNPLGGILMYSHMLREDLKKEENRENVVKIGREADRCKRIVKGLLDFARQTRPERSESNLNHILNEVVALLEQQAIFRNIELERDLSPSLPLIEVDVTQIQEVFMNIILNASQAMEGKGTIRIATRLVEDGGAVEIELGDTGPGIPPDDIDKIFEPFYTTKEVGRGTGLGLSIAYGIVERHQGSIRVESEEGKGTTFFIRLPVPEQPPPM